MLLQIKASFYTMQVTAMTSTWTKWH